MADHATLTTDLIGKTAVVTGASSGIGREIALMFAAHGASVVVADIDENPREASQPTAKEIVERYDTKATFVEWDVTNHAQGEAAMDAADEFGGVDIMVANAGIFRSTPFVDVTEDDYDTMMDINVKGVFFSAQAAAKRMIGRGGTIINMSSIAGLQGAATFSVYNTTKGAVRLLTMALAAELGPQGIRVNAIHPGVIETTMTTADVPIASGEIGDAMGAQVPMGRLGKPLDIAGAALFLASDLAGYVNGASILVDGGQLRI